MDIYDLVKRELENTNYDGLYSEDGECACELGDLAPCGEMQSSCTLGYKIEAGSDSEFDFLIVGDNNKCIRRGGTE